MRRRLALVWPLLGRVSRVLGRPEIGSLAERFGLGSWMELSPGWGVEFGVAALEPLVEGWLGVGLWLGLANGLGPR
jgi:hypothetical protein